MQEQEWLRREIEVRLIRETVYKAIDALNTKNSLVKDIEDNDKVIALIGKYLKENFSSQWEKYYSEHK